MNSISYGLAFGYLVRSVSTDSDFGMVIGGCVRFDAFGSAGSILITVPPVSRSIQIGNEDKFVRF